MALAHSLEDKVEAAYNRGDLLEKRRQLMSEWAVFIQAGAAQVFNPYPDIDQDPAESAL